MTGLLASIEANLHEHVAFVQRRVPGMTVDDREDLLLVDSGLGADTFNKILRARLDASAADRRIDEALGYFRRTDRPFAWWTGPCSRPADLGRRLEHRGLRPEEFEQGMSMDLARLPRKLPVPEGFVVRRAATPEVLAEFASVVAGDPPDPSVAAFFRQAEAVVLQDRCPMQCYVGYVDDVPAASAELFLSGNIAGIHMVSTRERFQRRGVGLAMTWNAAREGQRQGARIAALQATSLGQRVYSRLGFRACCEFVEYR